MGTRKYLVLRDTELPPLIGKALSLGILAPKELTKYFLLLLEKKTTDKSEEEILREIFEVNYGKNWEEKIGRRREVLELLLSMSVETKESPETKKEKSTETSNKEKKKAKNLAQKLREL